VRRVRVGLLLHLLVISALRRALALFSSYPDFLGCHGESSILCPLLPNLASSPIFGSTNVIELTERAESTVREERDRLLEEAERLRRELEAARRPWWGRVFGG
jgi:hypothetical protein